MENKGRVKLAIKAKFSNTINRIINPYPVKGQFLWEVLGKVNKLTNDQKINLLDEILGAYIETSRELRNYYSGRRNKKIVNKLRAEKIATGNKPAKVRTSKAQWEQMQAMKLAA